MKKLLFASTAAAYLLSASQAFAVETSIGNTCPGNGFSGLCLSADKLGPTIGSLITFGFVIVGIAALAFLVWGGIKWLTSEGDKNAVEGARNHIIAAIIGLVIIFLSYLLVNVLLAFFTGGQVTLLNLRLPSLGQP